MSFLQELKRRNVFKVGIAYLVVSWLVLQIADVVLGNIGSPPWVFKTLLLVIAIGFPITLVIAWAFELTPEGLKRDSDVPREESITPQTGARLNLLIIVVLAMAVVYFALDKFVLRAPVLPAVAGETRPAGEALPKSIAVLPFSNRSALEDDAFFVDGMHDDILTHLSKLATLDKVISRTTAATYRDSVLSIGEIANELGVATVLEGGVQRAGDSIRINMQLIDARTDQHLWAEIYERKMTVENLFEIQTEITREIVAALNGVMSDQDQELLEAWPTKSLDAYEQYTLGRQQLARRTAAALEQALVHFERAIELDPDYALAHVGVADVLAVLSTYSSVDMEDTFERRRVATDRALAINPLLGEAYTALAALNQDQGDIEAAERYYLNAIELNPNYATARHWYAMLLSDSGRIDEAIVQAGKARDIDPAAAILSVVEANMLAITGRYQEASKIIAVALKRNPEFPAHYAAQSNIYSSMGELPNALRWAKRAAELAPFDPNIRFWVCDLQAGLAMYKEAVACAESAAADIGPGSAGRLAFSRISAHTAAGSLPALIDSLAAEVADGDNDDAYRALAAASLLAGDRIGAGQALKRVEPEYFTEDDETAEAQPDGLVIIAAAYHEATGNLPLAESIYTASRERVEAAPPGLRQDLLANSILAAAVRGREPLAVERLRDALASNAPVAPWLLRAPVFDFNSAGSDWEAAVAELEARRDAQRAEYLATRDAPLLP